MLSTEPTGVAADQDLVVGTSWLAFWKTRLYLWPPPPLKTITSEGDHDDREGRDRRNPGRGDPPARSRAFLLA